MKEGAYLRFAKVTQHASFMLLAHLAALFCTQLARNLHSLYRSKPTALYSSIGHNSDVKVKGFVLVFPSFHIIILLY